MSLSTHEQHVVTLPDVQRDSIVEISQKLSDVAIRLRHPKARLNLDKVESLVLDVEPRAKELNRIVKHLIQAIREKQRSRRLRQLKQNDDHDTQIPIAPKRSCEGINSGSGQKPARPISKRFHRELLEDDKPEVVESAAESEVIYQSNHKSASNLSSPSKTADPVQEPNQNDSSDADIPCSTECVPTLTEEVVDVAKTTNKDQEDIDIGFTKAREYDREASHDAFSRDLVRIFNQNIGEDPGGPSGFLGVIAAPDIHDSGSEGDMAMLNGGNVQPCERQQTDDEATLVAVQSDSESFIEISKEALAEDTDQTTRGATVAYGFSHDTLDRLLPGVRLNDTTILDLMKTMLPASAEPLIARWAIKNFPTSGLCGDFITTSGPWPMLRHNMVSTHLFLAYNVVYGTLDCNFQGTGDHWILIAVDFLDSRVHVFGTEGDLELQANILAFNVGNFINNYRVDQDANAIRWSEPRHHPLYPHGIVPDGHNCGLCVIHRAETFVYPEKALSVPENITPAALSRQLDQLRERYRNSLLHQFKRFCADKALQARITSTVPKKRPFLIDSSDRDPSPQPIKISRFSLRIRPTSPDMNSKLTASVEWKSCLFRCAEANGFNGERIVKAFEEAPASDLSGVLRALQCMCEVANVNLLLRLKKSLTCEFQTSLRKRWPPEPKTAVEIAELHHAIGWFDNVNPYLSTFNASYCQISYHKSFQRKVDSLSESLREERKRRKRLKSKGLGNTQGQDRQRPQSNSSARKRVMAEVVGLIDPTGFDRAGIEDAVKRYEKAGKILNLLKGSRSPFWLLLYPLYDNQPTGFDFIQQPSLNIMDFGPPETFDRLRKPISRADLVEMTAQMARYFGSSLSTARPELDEINFDQESSQFDYELPIFMRSDKEIEMAKPRDIAMLFKRTET